MIQLSVLLASVLIALLAGGRLRGLLLERFRLPGLLVVYLILSLAPAAMVLAGNTIWPTGDTLMRIRTAYAGLLFFFPAFFLAWNLLLAFGRSTPAWRLPLRTFDRVGVWVLLIGLFAQAAVILTNRGAMPVSTDILGMSESPAEQYGLSTGLFLDRVLIGPDTVLPWLARTIPLPLLPVDPPFLSPAEIVIAAGLSLLVFSLMRPYDRWRRTRTPVSPRPLRSSRPRHGRRRS